MKKTTEYRGYWRSFTIFTCTVGFIVGVLSVISDHLPYREEGLTVLELILSYLAVMINSLPVWFILAMLVGYIFANDIKGAALLGCIYTIVAITFYFLIGHFYTDSPVSGSFKVVVYANWYGASAVGGILGGITGFLTKKTSNVLLILLAGLILQLFVYGIRSWGDTVGIAQNITFCLMIVCIVVYLVVRRRRERGI